MKKPILEPGRPGDLLTIFETACVALHAMREETQKIEGKRIGEGEGEVSLDDALNRVATDHAVCNSIAKAAIEALCMWLGLVEVAEVESKEEVQH